MALGRLVRRLVTVSVVAGAGALAIINPGAVKAFYEDLYPGDPAKRQALELCFMQDHKFNRLDSGEREACYHRMLQPLGELPAAAAGTPERPQANIVDLERAAGQGSLPRNDIRRLEQNENAVHSPH